MRESFVIHTEYIEDLPEESKAEFLMYIYNYGAKGIEPDLEGFAQTVWIKIQRRIDADIEQYEDTVRARSAAGKKHKGNQYTKELEQNGTNGTQFQSMEQNGTNGTVYVNDSDYVNESDNDTVNTQEIPEYIKKTEKRCVCNPKETQKLTKEIFELVSEHNKSAPPDKKVPIAPDIWQFTNKHMMQLLSATGTDEPPEKIKQALVNFLQIAKSDTWQKTFTWTTFCRHYVEYTPEYFSLSRYLNETPDTEDATKKPENIFYFAHKNDPKFIMRAFRDYKDEWEKAGRPDGEAYYKLQAEWIRRGPPADRKYKTYEKEA